MRRVREAIGPEIDLMCDINQRWRPSRRSISATASPGLASSGSRTSRRTTTTPASPSSMPRWRRRSAAASCLRHVPFRHMIEARSVDFVMIDLVGRRSRRG